MKLQHPLIIGLGITGLSVVDFFATRGISTYAIDDNKVDFDAPAVQFLTQRQAINQIDKISEVIVSPGVPLSHPVVVACREAGCPILGDIELAFRSLSKRQQFCAGITGSNGKTTTTELASHMLSVSGIKNETVGNVGTPILSATSLDNAYVIELSSYQIDITSTPALDVGIILNITPNHLDRYGSMEAYARSKCGIERLIKEGKPLYIGTSFPKGYLKYLEREPVPSLHLHVREIIWEGQSIGTLPEKIIQSESHHAENFLAALFIAIQAGSTPTQAIEAYDTFKLPPHRVEYVRDINGVLFWDDSKATSIDAVCKAVESIPGQIILLAGGVHKGEPYTMWKSLSHKIEAIITFGQAADIIEADVGQSIHTLRAETLQEAVLTGFKMAKSGMHVLLSPGCASYDMFKDYKDRGEQFQAAVKAL